jgi:hypothetical protein
MQNQNISLQHDQDQCLEGGAYPFLALIWVLKLLPKAKRRHHDLFIYIWT